MCKIYYNKNLFNKVIVREKKREISTEKQIKIKKNDERKRFQLAKYLKSYYFIAYGMKTFSRKLLYLLYV